ncbi:MAG: B12-binding domain-containing radical SAM protein [Verrucomicrobiales bacterium]|nr:B12-binding domain-containing radical SAM protein [Verrucomicrobiales bacterium]
MNTETARPVLTLGLILATHFDKGYSHTFGPLGLGFLAAAVRRDLPGVRVVMKERLEDLLAERPDIVGISAQTETYGVAIRLARQAKETLRIPVILGGVHITLLPESLHEIFDLAAVGEGEATLVDLLRSYLEKGRFDLEDLAKVPGLCFRRDGKIHRTAPRPVVRNLNELAPPNLDELPFHRASSMVCIVSARGCPYHCSFCVSEKFSQRYRSLSSDRVVNDIIRLVETRGVKHVVFYDDLLIADRKRLLALIAGLRETGLLGKLTFSCAVRANLVDETICNLLKELNVTDLGMGVETFSDNILKYYNKTGCTGAINQRAIDLLHANGIKVNPSIIFGAPVETREDMLITFRALFTNLRDGKINAPTWACLIPYPGTNLWDYALGRGIVSLDMNWDDFTAVRQKMYLCEKVPHQEFLDLMDEWTTKCSLVCLNSSSRGGSFGIKDRAVLWPKVARWRQQILARGAGELGDDVILEWGERLENRADGSWGLNSSAEGFVRSVDIQPTLMNGEFVEGSLVPAPQDSQSRDAEWTARGALTKGEVDTFLFVRFTYRRTSPFVGSDGLVISTKVSSSSNPALPLVLILQTRNGGEFMCVTGRSLQREGRQSIEVFFRDFQRAPWSPSADAQVDPGQITQIRAGWGGYYGRVKDVIEFRVGAPVAFRLRTTNPPKVTSECRIPVMVESRVADALLEVGRVG